MKILIYNRKAGISVLPRTMLRHPESCAHCPKKHVMLKDMGCLNCLPADYCKSIRCAMNPENPELVCPHCLSED